MAEALKQASRVGGTSDRHFTGTFDTAMMARAFSMPTPRSLKVPRRDRSTYPMDLTYSDFGRPVTVGAPPADQITGAVPN